MFFFQVSVVHGDLRELDLSDATVVVMYLLPEAMADIAESHLLPLLRRGGTCTTSPHEPSVAGDVKTLSPSPCCDTVNNNGVTLEGGVETQEKAGGVGPTGERGVKDGGIGVAVGGRGRSDAGGRNSSNRCRIVCNTWGIPGATAVREAGVGAYGGVKLRLFTSESLVVPSAAVP